jgi:hypothetical protein
MFCFRSYDTTEVCASTVQDLLKLLQTVVFETDDFGWSVAL